MVARVHLLSINREVICPWVRGGGGGEEAAAEAEEKRGVGRRWEGLKGRRKALGVRGGRRRRRRRGGRGEGLLIWPYGR